MAMIIIRSWIVHLTPIPCSLLHFCPNLARLQHYGVASGLNPLLILSTCIQATCIQIAISFRLGSA